VVLLVDHYLDGVFLGDFACKRIPVGNDHDWLAKVLIEVQLLQKLKHQNLVSYQHVWLEEVQTTNFGPKVACVFILQQYCNAGDLQQYIQTFAPDIETSHEKLAKLRRRGSHALPDAPSLSASSRRMPLDQIFSFFSGITAGLHHLHTNGYIHRDLKPSNCLLHEENSTFTILVSDFGEVQATNAKRTSTGATGTISYCAPEVLQREAPDGTFGNFTTKSDIFSLGMIVYFMCFGKLPYVSADGLHDEDEDLDKLRSEIIAWKGFDDANKIRHDLPERLYKFLRRLLSLVPTERPSTDEILQYIKSGIVADDVQPSHDTKATSPRISVADSPAPRPRTLARGRSHTVRPGISRLKNTELVVEATPRTTAQTQPERTEDSISGISIKQPLALESPKRESPTSPRLMLPPPPTPAGPRHRLHLEHLGQVRRHAPRTALFLLKIWTLTYPCMPYSTRPTVFWPLLLTATLDLMVPATAWQKDLVLLVIHFAVFAGASAYGMLCAGRAGVWPVF